MKPETISSLNWVECFEKDCKNEGVYEIAPKEFFCCYEHWMSWLGSKKEQHIDWVEPQYD